MDNFAPGNSLRVRVDMKPKNRDDGTPSPTAAQIAAGSGTATLYTAAGAAVTNATSLTLSAATDQPSDAYRVECVIPTTAAIALGTSYYLLATWTASDDTIYEGRVPQEGSLPAKYPGTY